MEIFILCGIYLVELVCYQLGLRILFEVRRKTKVWMFAGIIFPVVIGVLPVEASGKNVLVTASVLMVSFLTIEGDVKEKGVKLALTLLLLLCVEESLAYFYEKVPKYNSVHSIIINYLGIKCCAAIVVFLLNNIKIKIYSKKNMHIDSIIYLILGVILFSMMLCITTLNYTKPFMENSDFQIYCSILDIVISIGIFLLIVFIVYIKNTHEKMEQLLKTEQLMKESQVNYYKQLLKKESDTRKYRHDMVNHLVYLRDVLSRNRVEDAIKYLENIVGGFKKIQATYYVIGNEMIDTIMNYFFGMLPKSVKVEINGKCPVIIDMEDTDICAVFSNIFQNSVEEIVKNNIVDGRIIIEAKKGKQYIQYYIRNTLHTEIKETNIDKNGFPKSDKTDKMNHGIGMINTKSIVEKNFGKFDWYQENGYFCVNLVLPIKI